MNEFSIFDLKSSELVKSNDSQKVESNFYAPSANKGIDKVYTSYVRFLPNILNPSKSYIKKFVYWLQNADTEEKKQIDCPSSVGEKNSLIQTTFFTLKDSNSAHDQELSKKFTRIPTFITLVYVIKDEQDPSMEGKIKVFKFGKQLHDIIESFNADEPDNFMNPFEGKTFKIQVIEKAGFNNFQQSKFLSKSDAITVNGVKISEDTPKTRKQITEWLTENTPVDIAEYAYKPWTEETRAWVIEAIKSQIPSGKILNSIFKKTGDSLEMTTGVKTAVKDNSTWIDDEPVKKPIKKVPDFGDDEDFEKPVKKPVKKVVDFDEDDDDDFDEILSKPSTAKKPVKKVVDFDEDDDDDFVN